jgi:ABC-type dipeptide/oligopeptide/nickel transport system permease component
LDFACRDADEKIEGRRLLVFKVRDVALDRVLMAIGSAGAVMPKYMIALATWFALSIQAASTGTSPGFGGGSAANCRRSKTRANKSDTGGPEKSGFWPVLAAKSR